MQFRSPPPLPISNKLKTFQAQNQQFEAGSAIGPELIAFTSPSTASPCDGGKHERIQFEGDLGSL